MTEEQKKKLDAHNETMKKRSERRKKKFLAAFKESLGIVSYACEAAGVSRQTYRNWVNSDEDFKRQAEDIEENAIDMAESKLLQAIHDDNITAIIFYLKTKGKKRGYVEQVDNNMTINPFEKLMRELPDEDDE